MAGEVEFYYNFSCLQKYSKSSSSGRSGIHDGETSASVRIGSMYVHITPSNAVEQMNTLRDFEFIILDTLQ